MHFAYISLGSNLGNREANLNQALTLIKANSEILLQSSFYDNPAMEDAGPNDFINLVIKIKTKFDPHELLQFLQNIEIQIDPERNSRGRKLARYLDLDILIFDNVIISYDALILPHPRMKERPFIKKLLREIEIQEYIQDPMEIPEQNFQDPIKPQVSSVIAKINEFCVKFLKKNKFNLRPARLADIDALLKLDAEAFGLNGASHWTRDMFVKELNNPYALYLVVETKNLLSSQVIAFSGSWLVVDEFHIMSLAVTEFFKNRNIGKLLLLKNIQVALFAYVRNISLEVKEDNFPAIHVYEKFAFIKQGKRNKYYPDTKDAYIYASPNIQESEYLANLSLLMEALSMTVFKQL